MRSIQSIASQARREALSGGLPCGEYVYQDNPERYMTPAEQMYGSEANRDRWYKLTVRSRKNGGRLFTPEICHVANGAYTKANGASQFQYHFDLHSNPLDLVQYIDATLYDLSYEG